MKSTTSPLEHFSLKSVPTISIGMWLLFFSFVVVGGGILFYFAPFVLWGYNLERAGSVLDASLEWVEPRQADSLPRWDGDAPPERALGYLAAAQRWRPDHFHAYRMAGWVYAAQGNWRQALEAAEHALTLEPDNPLLALETGLYYQELSKVVAEAPREVVVTEFSEGHVIAPNTLLATPFCQGEDATSCYLGEGRYAMPYAGFANTPPMEADALFLHPPARVKQQVDVPPDLPALSFLLGLVPEAHNWGSDGATLRVWIQLSPTSEMLLYEHTIDATAAAEGWVTGWVDLSRWKGEDITLLLESSAGPAGNADADWYVWGNLAFTTVEVAQAEARAPMARAWDIWRSHGLDPPWVQTETE